MSNLSITTTQNVKLFFTPASVGERMLAYGADLLIKIAYGIVVYFLYSRLLNINNTGSHDEVTIALFGLLSLPLIFYTLVSETFMEGQTFGKKLLKIKVVKIDGYQAGFFDFLIRWIFSIVDIQIGYVPGIISMVSTKYTQRLGDLAAGTAVITEKSKYDISHTILMNVEEAYEPYFAQNQIILFSDNDIRIIKENFEMALPKANYEILDRLARKIESVMSIQNPFKRDRELIETLLKDYNFHTGK
jgi:uncharacterized RDD family membrane protein YckC